MKKAQKFAENPHCVDFRVFDNQETPQEEHINAVAAEE